MLSARTSRRQSEKSSARSALMHIKFEAKEGLSSSSELCGGSRHRSLGAPAIAAGGMFGKDAPKHSLVIHRTSLAHGHNYNFPPHPAAGLVGPDR